MYQGFVGLVMVFGVSELIWGTGEKGCWAVLWVLGVFFGFVWVGAGC